MHSFQQVPLQTLQWQAIPNSSCLLGEAPFWHPLEMMLYWVDIPGKQICRANIFMGQVERWNMSQEPACIAPMQGGGLIIGMRDGIYAAPNWQGELQLLVAAPFDSSKLRFNDGKCDALGRFWTSSIYEPKDKAIAALYCLSGQGPTLQLIEHFTNITTGNGLAWSPDNSKAYFADTPSHQVKVYDFDLTSGALSHESLFCTMPQKPKDWKIDATHPEQSLATYAGRPDGACVDQNGNYWTALFEGQRIAQFSAQGQLLAQYKTPAARTTMMCFGGDDLQTLYITTASAGRTSDEQTLHPQAGHVFFARVSDVGLPVQFYQP